MSKKRAREDDSVEQVDPEKISMPVRGRPRKSPKLQAAKESPAGDKEPEQVSRQVQSSEPDTTNQLGEVAKGESNDVATQEHPVDKTNDEEKDAEVKEVEKSQNQTSDENNVKDKHDEEEKKDEKEDVEESAKKDEDGESVKEKEDEKEDKKEEDKKEEGKKDEDKKEEETKDHKDDSKDEKEDKNGKEGNGKVFGSGLAFGSGFGSFTKNVFDKPSEKSGESAPAKPTPVFGSGLSFGSSSFVSSLAANSANPFADKTEDKNIFDSEASKETENAEEEREQLPEDYVQVQAPLKEQAIVTGEEEEKSVFTCRAKLYVLILDRASEGWKERGVGTLHVNTHESEVGTKKSRIVMRADSVLKVILNIPLIPQMDVFSGMKSSLSSEKFVRVTAVEDGKPCQYAFRTGNKETSNELYETLSKLVQA
uniref:ARAD1D17248p n=1 Tax=Blastobotrys adeninivorans TaxID=409370 RepID=A0A060T9E5_BLAAD